MKPRIRKNPWYGSWMCECNLILSYGATPLEAYMAWAYVMEHQLTTDRERLARRLNRMTLAR